MAKRKVKNWVIEFAQYLDSLPTPALFRKWAGIVTIAGVLEQKTWIHAYGENLYPNLYILFIGPPGVGKGVVTSRIWNLWASLSEDGQYVAPTSLTKASLIDALRDAERKIVRPKENPPVLSFNCLKICSREFSSLMPNWDNDFMAALTDIFDCKEYSERRRTHNLNFKIESPQITLFGSTSTGFLLELLPEGAWEQGFMSRTLLIYSTERVKRPLFSKGGADKKKYADLRHDLHIIGNLIGEFHFTETAADRIVAWDLADGPPKPAHPKLVNYNSRRTAHLLKLCMVASVTHTDSLDISLDDVNIAIDWLIEAERFMPDIFKAMASGGDIKVIEDTLYYTYQEWLKNQDEGVSEEVILLFLQERAPAYNVPIILNIMVKTGLLKKHLDGYIPKRPNTT